MWKGVANLQQAQDLQEVQVLQKQCVRQRPVMVLADPQTQGSAEDFCAALQRLAPGHVVLLYSDAVDADFVARVGLNWLQKSQAGRDQLRAAVQAALVKNNQEAVP